MAVGDGWLFDGRRFVRGDGPEETVGAVWVWRDGALGGAGVEGRGDRGRAVVVEGGGRFAFGWGGGLDVCDEGGVFGGDGAGADEVAELVDVEGGRFGGFVEGGEEKGGRGGARWWFNGGRWERLGAGCLVVGGKECGDGGLAWLGFRGALGVAGRCWW